MAPMTKIRALVLILIGVAVGSLMRSVHAQTDVVLFQVGQRLTLSYESERSIDCVRSSKLVDHSCDVNSPSLTRSAVFLRT